MDNERRISMGRALIAERVRRAQEAPHSSESGIWYVKNEPTDAVNMEEAKAVLEGKRKAVQHEVYVRPILAGKR